MIWPTPSIGASLGPAFNSVLAAGLSLVHHLLQNDRVVRNYCLRCLPIAPFNPPPHLELEDVEDLTTAPGGPAMLTPTQIRTQIAANWPILRVSDATEREGWDGLTKLNPAGPDTVLIARHMFPSATGVRCKLTAPPLDRQRACFTEITWVSTVAKLQRTVFWPKMARDVRAYVLRRNRVSPHHGAGRRVVQRVIFVADNRTVSIDNNKCNAARNGPVLHGSLKLDKLVGGRPEAIAMVCQAPSEELRLVPIAHLANLLTASFWNGNPGSGQIKLPTTGLLVPGREGRVGGRLGRRYIVRVPEEGKSCSPAPPSPTNPNPVPAGIALPEYRYHTGAFGALLFAFTPS
ncbi:hypothetical protein HDU87_001497 [Geranomyces variabilis]|uniref:Uncharacterized protein n=1 Tax=Geranomyces variabilis TaxID=109894 RepID=A0AAD5TB30_9FUNG|nr:hypothetical protein HDU87_001497 [Geranomyces variabilis]